MHSPNSSDEGSDQLDSYGDYDLYYNQPDYPDDLLDSSPSASPSTRSYSDDPEYFEFYCMTAEEAKNMLNACIGTVCQKTSLSTAATKAVLRKRKWNVEDVVRCYHQDSRRLLIESDVEPHRVCSAASTSADVCPVCVCKAAPEEMASLACLHRFCASCWRMYLTVQLNQGCSTSIECMETNCHLLVLEDFALTFLAAASVELVEKYERFAFHDQIKTHPLLRFCPGTNCNTVFRVAVAEPKKVTCNNCGRSLCFTCGREYHAPTNCCTIQRWLTKCADDSETANYITANTKDCPNCHICIEKNGGCNHM
ncbi:unnamed protein product, partial [Soboliphyme baturini]|uniref:RBR-type E3 ubiquitin transferase n=1 Tax=Soboliphyme baturini TaxID=241478 RepID=A0A183J5L4_9BILA